MKRVTLDEYIAAFEAMPAAVHAARAAGLEAAGELIEREAKGMLGTYQAGGGDMPAWQQLSQVTKDHRAALGFPEDEPELRTVRLRQAISRSVNPADGVLLVGVASRMVGTGTAADPLRDIGKVAVAQEMGTAEMPRRSFLGLGMYRRAHDAVNIVARAVALALAGR